MTGVRVLSGSSRQAQTQPAGGLRFQVLGPVRAWYDDRELDVGSPQQRAVLAILLLSQGRQVAMDILVDAIWGQDPPRSAVGTVRTYISRLRRCLDPVTGYRAAGLLTSVGDGYAIETDAVTVDVELFTQQVRQAQLTRGSGDLTRAASQLGEALALWRGMPLAGISGPYADSQRARLTELRLAATEDRLSIDIESGRHLAAVAELRALLDDHPLCEKLSELLMLALYRSGRQAEALSAFDDLRRLLSDELGIDPGPGLRALHQRILQADDSLIPPASADHVRGPAARPADARLPVPPVPAELTGRAGTLDAVTAALREDPASVVAITGMPGIGKTALAIQAAHAVRAAFPDGQHFLELDDADGHPADPREVLAAAVPAGRALVVLDGVRDTAQAQSLLGALRGCAVIVTTQRRMFGLPGVRWFEVGPLSPGDAMAFFERLIGRERVAAERAGAEWVLAMSAGQPIAIRTAAARLVARPAWKIWAMASQLEEELSLPMITHEDCKLVEAPFERAYQQLADEEAFVFRQAAAATADGLEVSVADVAVVTGMRDHMAFALLESLADVHLVWACAFGTYRYDPLVKIYARRKAIEEDGYRMGTPGNRGLRLSAEG